MDCDYKDLHTQECNEKVMHIVIKGRSKQYYCDTHWNPIYKRRDHTGQSVIHKTRI